MESQRRISVIEIAVAAGVLVVAIAIFLPAIATTGHRHHGGSQLRDATQIRGIHQAMVVWAENHGNGPPAEGESESPAAVDQPPR